MKSLIEDLLFFAIEVIKLALLVAIAAGLGSAMFFVIGWLFR